MSPTVIMVTRQHDDHEIVDEEVFDTPDEAVEFIRDGLERGLEIIAQFAEVG